MHAAYYEANGAAAQVLRLADVATPEPGPGEVRVRLATSGVNPSDVKSREGRTRKITFPRVIPHSDGAGVIDKVGSGVPAARVGERVWTWNGQWKRAFGTAAEHIVLPSALAARLPDHVGFAEGACLGIPAMTAYHAVATAETDSASTVLISGGAGGVGHYAIQFAKARGAFVLTTRGGPERPLSFEEISAKFHDNVAPVLTDEEADALAQACRTLPDLAELTPLTTPLAGAARHLARSESSTPQKGSA